MAEIDEIKEEINYLKVWLGITLITTIGLISWLLNNYATANTVKIIADIFVILVLNLSVILIDKKIKKRIKKLRDL